METIIEPKTESSEINEITLPVEKLKYCITQAELAAVTGVTTSYIGAWAKSKKLSVIRQKKHTLIPSSTARAFLEHRGYKFPQKVMAFQMLKGGSTKTTSAFNLAVRLNHYGAKVLVFDLDPQGNITGSLDVDTSDKNVFINVVEDGVDLKEVIVPISEGLDLIPSDFNNADLDFHITNKKKNPMKFISDHINQVKGDYDYVIIDCNPSLSTLNASIALASDTVTIPVNPDKYSKSGLEKMVEELGRIQSEYDKSPDYRILYTRYDARTSTSQFYLADFVTHHRDRMFKSVVRNTNDVTTAIHKHETVFQLKSSYAKEDYDTLTLEVLGLRKEESQGRV